MGMIFFLAGLYSQEFIRINCRYAIFAMETKAYGIHLFPTLYGKPYLDYLSPFIFLTYLASFGGKYINMMTITLPSAVTASLTLVMIYKIGCQISRKFGLYAVLICLMTYTFVTNARGPSMDMFVTFFTSTSFFLVYTAERKRTWQLLLFVPLCFVASFSIRGPLGIVVPAAVVLSYYCVNRQWKMMAISAAVSAFIAILCMMSVLCLCSYSGGRELPELFLQNQIFSRISNGKPIWFFFVRGLNAYAIAFPLALFVIAFYAKKLIAKPLDQDSDELHLMRSLTAWLLIVLIGLSIPGNKHMRYILPIIPAAALLSTWVLINFDRIIIFDKIKKCLFLLCRLAPFALLLSVISGVIVIGVAGLKIPKFPFYISMVFFTVLCVAVWAIPKYIKAEYHDLGYVCIMVGVMMILHIMVIGPIEEYMEGSRKFIADVENIRKDKPVFFFNLGPDGDELKYLVNLPPERMFIPEFIFPQSEYIPKEKYESAAPINDQPNKLKGLKGKIIDKLLDILPYEKTKTFPPLHPAYICYPNYDNLFCSPRGSVFITSKRKFKRDIPDTLKVKIEIVAEGNLGHRPCIAFRMKYRN